MCNRRKSAAKLEIVKWSRATFEDGYDYTPQPEINGFAHTVDPIIKNTDPGLITGAVWGLVPFWAKDPSQIWNNTLNARIETLHEKASFKNYVQQRCLIPCSAYYEWRWEDPKGKVKTKYEITSPEGDQFALAGLYSTWRNSQTGEIMDTYTIVTTDANPTMQYVHNNKLRMPVMLKYADHQAFLSDVPITQFAYPNYDVEVIAKPLNPIQPTLI